MRRDRWSHLVDCGSAIERAEGTDLRRVISTRLASILEVFPRELDPATDPEGVAVRRLALALAAALERDRAATDTGRMGVILETFPSVEVADMGRAAAFYAQALEAEVTFSSPTWTSVRIAGVRVGLALSPGHRGVRTGLHFAVADRAAVRARVIAAGGRVIASSVQVAAGIVVDDLADTEGNVFAIIERRG